MSSVNGETLLAMKKCEERSAIGLQLDYWLIGDYNDQDNPYYIYEGSEWHINCVDLLESGDAKARIGELVTRGVKEIIFPATDTDPEVKVNIVDYPKSVTFTRTT